LRLVQHWGNAPVSNYKTYCLELTGMAKRDELVERCKSGDTLAYKELYQRYERAMYGTCVRILGNSTAAEDVLQESFIEAFKNLGSFEYRTSFGGWIKQICVNRSINQLKKRKIDWIDIDSTQVYEHPEENSVDENAIQLKVASVKKAIMQLPDGYRAVLNLYLLEGYDHEEIAGILNVAESTTRSQYIRAKQKLLQILNKEHEQAGKIY
jgi:RNA polymerase sigma factor (sigma-70 family)